MRMAPPVWIGAPPEEFRGNGVVFGEHSAEFFGVDRGDGLTVFIEDVPHRFVVAAVARSSGLFTDDGRSHTLVVPMEKLAIAVAGRGRSSVTYVRAAEPAGPEAVAALIEGLEEVYPRYRVRETVPQSEVDLWTRDSTLPFTIMSFLVFFMSVFIIFTCFRVITLERLPVIGTFRTYGGTVEGMAGLARLVNGENVVKTRIRLDDVDGFLRDGFNVDVEIEIGG